jgi:uncharacterized protein with PCYCGC motif
MPKQPESKNERVSPLALIAGGLVLIAIVTFAVLQKKEQSQQEPASQTQTAQVPAVEPSSEPQSEAQTTVQVPASRNFRMPPFLADAQSATLQPTKDPTMVNPGAMAAYQVAQKKPKLLAQLPCFCYCDRFGHGSLHDCYVSDHAESCDICLKEALQADQMDQQGIPVNQIRDAIVAQFHPRDSEHTD